MPWQAQGLETKWGLNTHAQKRRQGGQPCFEVTGSIASRTVVPTPWVPKCSQHLQNGGVGAEHPSTPQSGVPPCLPFPRPALPPAPTRSRGEWACTMVWCGYSACCGYGSGAWLWYLTPHCFNKVGSTARGRTFPYMILKLQSLYIPHPCQSLGVPFITVMGDSSPPHVLSLKHVKHKATI